MESTQTGDALTVDQAAVELRRLLGATKPPKEVPDEVKKQPEVKVESIETQKPEEDVQKAEGQDDKAKTEGKDQDTQTGVDEAFFETLDELAEAAGVPLEKLLTLKTRTKVDGVEDTVPLAQIVKNYQLDGHLTRKQQELAEKLKTVDSEREKYNSELNSKLQEANQLIGHFEQQFMAEFNSVNWQELRQSDPAEFAARKQEYNDRYSQLMNYRQQIQVNAHRLQTEAQEKAQAKFSEIVKAEEEKLISKLPDWKDPEKAKTGKKDLSDYLRNYGFNDGEISQIYDHRQVDIIRKAMLYDKQSTKSEVALKKVVTLPKILKPSSPSVGEARKAAIAEKLKVLSKSGRVEDAAEVFKAMLKKK